MKTPRTVKLSAENVEIIIKELSLIVVSLDRIGSNYHDDPERHARETGKFLSKINAFKRLARARAILAKAYSSQSTEREVADLEESAEELVYWQAPK